MRSKCSACTANSGLLTALLVHLSPQSNSIQVTLWWRRLVVAEVPEKKNGLSGDSPARLTARACSPGEVGRNRQGRDRGSPCGHAGRWRPLSPLALAPLFQLPAVPVSKRAQFSQPAGTPTDSTAKLAATFHECICKPLRFLIGCAFLVRLRRQQTVCHQRLQQMLLALPSLQATFMKDPRGPSNWWWRGSAQSCLLTWPTKRLSGTACCRCARS